jgi:ribosomal protein S18 acetylase RimI-like enzyme
MNDKISPVDATAPSGASPPDYRIEPITDVAYLRSLLMQRWGDMLLMGGRTYPCDQVNAFRAVSASGETLGYITWQILRSTVFVFTIDSFVKGGGIGGALLDMVATTAREAGARAIRVMTTNDNTPALHYFQKRGFQMVAFFPGAVDIYRMVAPALPKTGFDDIPMRDAIELEKSL